jgi:hypothetical protein
MWYFVRSWNTMGWVRKEFLATTTERVLKNFDENKDFAVVVKNKTAIMEGKKYYNYFSLGDMFLFLPEKTDKYMHALIPARNEDGTLKMRIMLIKEEDIHKGFVPYTKNNAIKLAFKSLNAPYGWGGTYGEQDCSGYIMSIFRAMGVTIPRNSFQQGKVGVRLLDDMPTTASKTKNSNDTNKENLLKLEALKNAVPGATVIYMPGHIMLYLGQVNGKYYVINSLYAAGDIQAARVVVNTVDIMTKKGTFLNRSKSMQVYRADKEDKVIEN